MKLRTCQGLRRSECSYKKKRVVMQLKVWSVGPVTLLFVTLLYSCSVERTKNDFILDEEKKESEPLKRQLFNGQTISIKTDPDTDVHLLHP